MNYYVRGIFGGWREVTKDRYERVVRHIVTGSNAPYEDKVAAIERRTIVSELPLTRAELEALRS